MQSQRQALQSLVQGCNPTSHGAQLSGKQQLRQQTSGSSRQAGKAGDHLNVTCIDTDLAFSNTADMRTQMQLRMVRQQAQKQRAHLLQQWLPWLQWAQEVPHAVLVRMTMRFRFVMFSTKQHWGFTASNI